MSNGAQAPARQGLHPLAWVGIGCGVLLMIVIIAIVIGSFFVARAVKDVADDFEDNPGLAAARLIVKASPDLEEVEVDESAGTMTIRNTKTGELITVDFEDIENGRFSWTAGDEEVTVDVSEAESGTVKIESSDGEGFSLTTGAAVTEDRPDWVPLYPGTEPEGLGTMTTNDSIHGSFSISTGDSVNDVSGYYQNALKEAGFEVKVNTYTGGGQEGAMLNASNKAEDKTVVVILNRKEDQTQVNVTYSAGT